MWPALIAAGAGLIGNYLSNKDAAKSPSAPPPIDMDELARLMFTNTRSPWGGMSYTEGDDGQWTGEYKFSDEVQPVFDRRIDRSLNPDQAYPIPEQLRALHEALMAKRSSERPPIPLPERRPANIGPPANVGPPPGFPSEYRPFGG